MIVGNSIHKYNCALYYHFDLGSYNTNALFIYFLIKCLYGCNGTLLLSCI